MSEKQLTIEKSLGKKISIGNRTSTFPRFGYSIDSASKYRLDIDTKKVSNFKRFGDTSVSIHCLSLMSISTKIIIPYRIYTPRPNSIQFGEFPTDQQRLKESRYFKSLYNVKNIILWSHCELIKPKQEPLAAGLNLRLDW